MNPRSTTRPTAGGLAPTLLTLLLLAACGAPAGDVSSSGESGGSRVLAKVGDREITEAEVRQRAKGQIQQVEAQLHQILEANLREMVDDHLLEAEAARRGITREQLVAAEVDATVEVTDADVERWWEENQDRVRGTKEQLAPQIRQFLQQQSRQAAYGDFLASLREGTQVAYLLEPPRVEVEAVGPSFGPADAPVTLVEFSDFECPFCSRVVPTLERIKEEYGDRVRVVFRQFPLPSHTNAPKAAEASLCADEQGKFWEMHDLMFEEQRQLAVANLKDMAQRLGLDSGQFDQCLDSGKYAGQVAADKAAGEEAGVSGTPATFVNGRLVSGAVPYEQFAEIIDQELELSGD